MFIRIANYIVIVQFECCLQGGLYYNKEGIIYRNYHWADVRIWVFILLFILVVWFVQRQEGNLMCCDIQVGFYNPWNLR